MRPWHPHRPIRRFASLLVLSSLRQWGTFGPVRARTTIVRKLTDAKCVQQRARPDGAPAEVRDPSAVQAAARACLVCPRESSRRSRQRCSRRLRVGIRIKAALRDRRAHDAEQLDLVAPRVTAKLRRSTPPARPRRPGRFSVAEPRRQILADRCNRPTSDRLRGAL